MERLSDDTVRGCLFGAAVGDALAYPYGGLSPVFTASLGREAIQRFKPHRAGAHPLGQVTFSVQLTIGVVEALAHNGGAVSGDTVGSYLYPLARDRALVAAPAALFASLEAWARGRPAAPRSDAEPPIHLLPLALIPEESGGDPLRDLEDAARPTGHDAPESLALGAAFFAAVRYTLSVREVVLGDFLDAVRAAAARFAPAASESFNAMLDLLSLSERDGIGPLAERIASASAFPLVAGMMSFVKSPYDAERSLLIAQRSGAGCAAAFVCGALGGAFNGAAAVPRTLVENLVVRDELRASVGALLGCRPSVVG